MGRDLSFGNVGKGFGDAKEFFTKGSDGVGLFGNTVGKAYEYVMPGDDGVGLMGNTFDTAKEKVGGRLLNMATDSLLAGSPEQMELERPQMQPYISDYRSNMPVLAPEQTRFGFEDMANYIVAPMRLDMSGDSSSVWGNFASQRTV